MVMKTLRANYYTIWEPRQREPNLQAMVDTYKSSFKLLEADALRGPYSKNAMCIPINWYPLL